MKNQSLALLACLAAFLVIQNHCVMVEGIRLESEPSGAKVYVIPWSIWEQDPSIQNDDIRLAEFRVAQGNTPVTIRAKEKVYAVIFDLNGKKEMRKLDVIASKSEGNRVMVVFE